MGFNILSTELQCQWTKADLSPAFFFFGGTQQSGTHLKSQILMCPEPPSLLRIKDKRPIMKPEPNLMVHMNSHGGFLRWGYP